MRRLSALRKDRLAASSVEYALILGLIFLAMITSLRSVALTTTNMWNFVATQVLSP